MFKSNLIDAEDLYLVITPKEFISRVGEETVACRTQLPLRLAWSLSVSTVSLLLGCFIEITYFTLGIVIVLFPFVHWCI
jgi:hypothetical protein